MTPDLAPLPASPALRRRIGWLCQFVRWGAIAYAAWVLAGIASYWSDPPRVARHWSAWLHADVPAPEPWQQAVGFAIHFALWVAVAAAVWSVWRLFSSYLDGSVFTADAATWLRRVGLFGLAAQLGDMLARPLVSAVVTASQPAGARLASVFAQPPDLLNFVFLLGFLALAHIFKAAAEIAEDHAQIV
jgi:hypothetical protein